MRHEIPDADPRAAQRLAAVIQLLSSSSSTTTTTTTWQALRDYWDLDGAAATEASVLAIELLLAADVPRKHTPT